MRQQRELTDLQLALLVIVLALLLTGGLGALVMYWQARGLVIEHPTRTTHRCPPECA